MEAGEREVGGIPPYNPPKKEKRTKKVVVRVTEEEHRQLKELSEQTGLTIADIFRRSFKISLSKRKPRGKKREITIPDRYLYELNKIGVNLNQIARRVNIYRLIDEQALIELQRIANAMEDLKRRILAEIERNSESFFSFASREEKDDSQHSDS